jgi:hypothetical protein
MSLKKRALYQGTALAVPIRQHFLGFSPWFISSGAHPLHPLEKAGAKALQCSLLAARLKPCPDTELPTSEYQGKSVYRNALQVTKASSILRIIWAADR